MISTCFNQDHWQLPHTHRINTPGSIWYTLKTIYSIHRGLRERYMLTKIHRIFMYQIKMMFWKEFPFILKNRYVYLDFLHNEAGFYKINYWQCQLAADRKSNHLQIFHKYCNACVWIKTINASHSIMDVIPLA